MVLRFLERIIKVIFLAIIGFVMSVLIFLTIYSFLVEPSSPIEEPGLEKTACNMPVFVQFQSEYVKGGTLEYVSFTAQHGSECNKRIIRHGVLLTKEHAKATILICHGFMCNKFDVGFLRLLFPDYNVMTFDFRAHGEHIAHDQLCTFGKDEAYDVIAAVEYLKSRPDICHVPLLAYGFSMGAVAAIQAQSKNPSLFTLMILDCPYDYSENIIKRGLANMKMNILGYTFSVPGRSFFEQYAFHPYLQSVLKVLLKTVANMDATDVNTQIYPISPAESIASVTIPCFFIHCKHDEKVGIAAAKHVYSNASGYKRLWLTAGRRHFDSFFYNPEKYIFKINSFIESVLSGAYRHKVPEKITEDMC